MNNTFRSLSLSIALLTLASCASTVDLSSAAKSQRDQMTPQHASALAAQYAKPGATSGGLCMVGKHPRLTHVDYAAPITVAGPIITFTGHFAKFAGSSTSGNVMAGAGQVTLSYTGNKAEYGVDLRKLHEIRLLEIAPDQFGSLCPDYKGGWVIVMKPEGGLPDNADLSFNVTTQADLDAVLAALTYFSPKARLVGGLGL